MIVILKRDDLPPEHRHRTVDSLELDHSGLSPEVVDQAELIVFVEGAAIKFLKQRQDIQSKESFEVLIGYITSTPPTFSGRSPYGAKRYRRKRKE